MDIDTLQPIHPVIFFVSFICIILTIIWAIQRKDQWLVAVLPMLFFLHIFVYNIALHLSLLPWETLETWSGAIRLQALVSFMVMLLFYPNRRK